MELNNRILVEPSAARTAARASGGEARTEGEASRPADTRLRKHVATTCLDDRAAISLSPWCDSFVHYRQTTRMDAAIMSGVHIATRGARYAFGMAQPRNALWNAMTEMGLGRLGRGRHRRRHQRFVSGVGQRF